MVTVLENEVKAKKEEIQTFLLALCHLLQSHCGPIGLPAPIFLADKIAYNGHRMLAAYEEYIPEQDQFNENIDHPDFYKKLTMAITKRFDVQDQQHSTSTT
uniref:Piwi domain-containing protein n=1 Tax=Panagrolaimus superbus TaxID=310955 RepID=A0A914ZBB3_9BILA